MWPVATSQVYTGLSVSLTKWLGLTGRSWSSDTVRSRSTSRRSYDSRQKLKKGGGLSRSTSGFFDCFCEIQHTHTHSPTPGSVGRADRDQVSQAGKRAQICSHIIIIIIIITSLKGGGRCLCRNLSDSDHLLTETVHGLSRHTSGLRIAELYVSGTRWSLVAGSNNDLYSMAQEISMGTPKDYPKSTAAAVAAALKDPQRSGYKAIVVGTNCRQAVSLRSVQGRQVFI